MIEVVTGQRIHDALRALVIQAVGLTRTFTRTEEAVTYRSRRRTARQGQARGRRPICRSSTVTAGGVWMSLSDMLAYAKFHLGDGTGGDGKPVLSARRSRRCARRGCSKVGTDDEMGLGWHLRKLGGVMTAAHGGTLGHIPLLELVPERKMALAILTNHSNGWRLIQDVERAGAEAPREASRWIRRRRSDTAASTRPCRNAPILAHQPDAAPTWACIAVRR